MTHSDRLQLMSLINHPAYQVFLTMMETVCLQAETEHFRLDPTKVDEKFVAASHNNARAQRLFFERIQRMVLNEIDQLNDDLNQSQPEGEPETSLIPGLVL